MSRSPSEVPNPAVRRLSLYLRQLESLQAEGVATVSSRKLAQSLNLSDAQVRKDLAYFGQFGRPGVGYEVIPLIQRLRSIFGTDRITHTLLVGAGNLGKAVAAYGGFKDKGFELVAVFDADEKKVGRKVAKLPVRPMNELDQTVAEHNVRLAILAVPASAAQDVTDRLLNAGVRGILNFAPAPLKTPPGVTVRGIDVAAELEQLSFLSSIEATREETNNE